jgi:CRISPR-associated endonuclease/helicase Cas3
MRCVTARSRVIYAIPYTSIIEQTAGIFRGIFGDENVIEHHSNVEVDDKQETATIPPGLRKLGCPADRHDQRAIAGKPVRQPTSRCRKLHNLVGSVIVLDEAQLLPVPYLQPVVDVLAPAGQGLRRNASAVHRHPADAG